MYKWFFAMTLAFLTTAVFDVHSANAQAGGPGGGGDTGGIDIDANGVLRTKSIIDQTGRIDSQRLKAAKASLNQDLQRPSQSRKVSLRRYEAAVMAAQASGGELPDDIKYLAGLTGITAVYAFPESGEIVIEGPAEGFYINSQNRVVGTETGAAILQGEDLVVALRAFRPGARPTGNISVSIDPTAEGSVRFSEAFARLAQNPQAIRGNEIAIANNLKQAMGMQTITIKGVSPKTRFAQVLAEADYRMKLIGMGLENPPVRINNYVDHMPMVANNALNRWYFQPLYDCVALSSDELSMEFRGGGVELVAEQDRVNGGEREQNVGKANKAARNFAASFTKEYELLSKRMTLYGELRNLMDIAVAAAFIQKMDLFSKTDWDMSHLGDESKFKTERFAAPTQVEPVINTVWRDGAFSTPIGGGVSIRPYTAFSDENLQKADSREMESKREAITFDNLKNDQWWWD